LEAPLADSRAAKTLRAFLLALILANALAFRNSREQLVISLSILLTLLLISSGLVYFAEREAQPDKFSSIPAALWWGVSTLTPIGYGDIVPVTPIGRTIAALISILGIGVFALPAGILAAAFALHSRIDRAHDRCPHCGKPIDSSDV
jgi:voltage-gated potassium channel